MQHRSRATFCHITPLQLPHAHATKQNDRHLVQELDTKTPLTSLRSHSSRKVHPLSYQNIKPLLYPTAAHSDHYPAKSDVHGFLSQTGCSPAQAGILRYITPVCLL